MTLDDQGTVLEVSAPPNPDSMPGVEFYAGILIPGMVNAHTHLELSYLRGAIAPGSGFVGFAAGLRENRGRFTPEQIAGAIDYWDARMWAEGVQAAGDICNGESTFGIKRKSRIHYHSFAELFGLEADETAAGQIAGVAAQARRMGLPASVTPHSTYSLNEQGFVLAVGGGENTPLSIHFMESPGEKELYEDRGEMKEWYERAGMRTDFTSLYNSPAERIVKLVPAVRKVLLVHNTLIGEKDIELLATHFGDNLTLVICPLSNRYITGLTPPYGLLRRSGVRIAVGTDSLASNWSLSMIDELKAVRGVPLEQMLAWATVGGAQALGIDSRFGSLEKGKRPGIVLLSGVDWETMTLTGDARCRRLA